MPLFNGELPGVDACLGDLVGDTFQRIAASEADTSRVGYQYYASTRGTYMQWPGVDDCSDSYDPRFREWYAGAAAGPKDVIVVIDNSGSMGSCDEPGSRCSKARDAAQIVINTLTDADYATVIKFSSGSKAMHTTLQQATQTKRQEMVDWIGEEMGTKMGSTNFIAAFADVFSVLGATSVSSGCNRVVLFLSDGSPNSFSAADFSNTRAQLMALGNAHLLTYAFGSSAPTAVLKQLACENEGIMYQVADDANLNDVMAEYFKLLSPMMEPCLARWISYEDSYSGKELLGVCMAAYRKTTSASASSCDEAGSGEAGSGDAPTPSDDEYYRVPELIGVACVDMSLIASDSDLRAQSSWPQFQERVQAERTNCPRKTLTEGQLEMLRRRAGGASAMCDAGTAIPAGMLTEPSYKATGMARDCSESFNDYGSGPPPPLDNGGLTQGVIIGVAGFFLVILIGIGRILYKNRDNIRKSHQKRSRGAAAPPPRPQVQQPKVQPQAQMEQIQPQVQMAQMQMQMPMATAVPIAAVPMAAVPMAAVPMAVPFAK